LATTATARATAAQIAAFGADLGQLTADRPDLLEALSQRYDPEAGSLIPTNEEIRTSPLYRDLENELRKLRAAGHRALDQIKAYEARLEELEDQHGVNGEALAPSENPPDASDGNALAENLDTAELAELTRQNAELSKDLDAKDATIEELGQDLKTKDQTIGELERQNEQFDNDLKAKDHRLEALEQEREKLTNDLAAKERTIAALSTEGSTRLTT
tara:strand:- start:632 stop:1279 length:648 start_codon:yes stop_codon:yes gene_type:complete